MLPLTVLDGVIERWLFFYFYKLNHVSQVGCYLCIKEQ